MNIRRNECPNCCGFLWRPGPLGGATQNMECVGCKRRFNVLYVDGEMAMAEELLSEAEGGGHWRTDLFPEVLQ